MRTRCVRRWYFCERVTHVAFPQIWALAVSSDERTIVSGAADSVVTFWEDCTEEQELEKEAKRADLVSKYVLSRPLPCPIDSS